MREKGSDDSSVDIIEHIKKEKKNENIIRVGFGKKITGRNSAFAHSGEFRKHPAISMTQ
jgi:hypothetical protein